jgi:glycosyltransferase involved in cell wall biosynthesis
MKILMLINGLYPEVKGGIEKVGVDLAAQLAKDHEVVVYTFYDKDLPAREIRNGFLIKRQKSSSDYGLRLPFGIHTVNVLRQLTSEAPKPDIMLVMSLGNGFISYLINKLFKIPYFIYALGADWYIARDKKILGRSFRLGIEYSTRLITQTHLIKNEVLDLLPKANIEVISNGLTLPDQRANGDKIISLGRLNEVKGITYLIEAVRSIDDCPELLVAGSGPEENRLKQQAEGLNITFTGSVPETEPYFLQGSIFVLPSLSEGLPQAMLEAMSYGLPVVATRVGGIPDIIEHGKTGFLVDPRDPEDLRKYIKILIADDSLRKTMSDNCLKEIQKFSWQNILAKFERLMRMAV